MTVTEEAVQLYFEDTFGIVLSLEPIVLLQVMASAPDPQAEG
jgi:hypothetical protein